MSPLLSLPLPVAEADSFSSEWREKTRTLNHALHPRLEQSQRNQFSNNRGLPSSSQRPQNPVAAGASMFIPYHTRYIAYM